MKKNKNIIALPVAEPTITEAQIIEALGEFAETSAKLVGVDRTYEVLGFLTELIMKSPEMYQKITHPDNVERFESITEANTGKTPGPFEIMGIMGQLKEIFA